MCACVSLCVCIPVWPVRAPHLLVVDVGQDAGNNLQQEDDEEQDEVLGREGRSEQGHRHPHPQVAALSSQWSQSEGSPQSGCRPPLGAHRGAGQVGGTSPANTAEAILQCHTRPPSVPSPPDSRGEAPPRDPRPQCQRRPPDRAQQIPPLLEGGTAAQETGHHDNNASHHQDVGCGQVGV